MIASALKFQAVTNKLWLKFVCYAVDDEMQIKWLIFEYFVYITSCSNRGVGGNKNDDEEDHVDGIHEHK